MIGVIHRGHEHPRTGAPRLTRLEVTATIHQRKARMYQLAEGYIALPGGYGTLDELFETLTWAQIGEHAKPVGLLNVNGYYDDLLRMLDRAVSEKLLFPEHRRTLLVEWEPQGLLEAMERVYQAPTKAVKRWWAGVASDNSCRRYGVSGDLRSRTAQTIDGGRLGIGVQFVACRPSIPNPPRTWDKPRGIRGLCPFAIFRARNRT